MALKVHNTMSKFKESFEPINPGKVGMYVCGVTVYDMCHIGHARSAVVFDTIYRYLQYLDYDVTYVRNFTDVDDKIIKRANETGRTSDEVATQFIDEFYTDMDALNVRRPTIEPKATEHIEGIIALVKDLEEKGFAYEVDGDVYFEVEKFQNYGQLSHRNLKELLSGARIDIDERKKAPVDFALWKSSKPGEPSWESPWGPGRPGWHIECSAMGLKHIGNTLDIHGGGEDLVFPHHENEITQSEAATGHAPFVKYWLHNAFIKINKEKMSKSLGNFFTIREVLELYPPEALRLFILSSHYRSPIDYSDQALSENMSGLDRIYGAWEALESFAEEPEMAKLKNPNDENQGMLDKIDSLHKEFLEAMDDDFNTAKAVGHLFELVRIINAVFTQKRKSAGRPQVLTKAKEEFEIFKDILGLPIRPPAEFRASVKQIKLKSLPFTAEDIEKKIAQRNEARMNKDFAKADEIRDELLADGIVIKDGKDGTTWDIK